MGHSIQYTSFSFKRMGASLKVSGSQIRVLQMFIDYSSHQPTQHSQWTGMMGIAVDEHLEDDASLGTTALG